MTYSEKLQGAVAQVGTTLKTGPRNYTKDAYWVDGTRRQHQVYEAAWPTNVGIDVKMRAHGFQGPNWDNLNDFVIVEVELKNTGVVDMNMDGVAETARPMTSQALAFQLNAEAYMSVSSYAGGGRNVNDIVPTIIARQSCWIDDLDENGEPWAFAFYRTAPTTGTCVNPPTAGNWDFGFNGGDTEELHRYLYRLGDASMRKSEGCRQMPPSRPRRFRRRHNIFGDSTRSVSVRNAAGLFQVSLTALAARQRRSAEDVL